MLELEEALALVRSARTESVCQEVPVEEARNRILFRNILADRPYPPFNRVTMDGYAVKAAELAHPQVSLKIQGKLFAGQIAERQLASGFCYSVMTGTPLPSGADAVIRKEDALEQGGQVAFQMGAVKPGANVAEKGQDASDGAVILKAGSPVTLPVIGALATVGLTHVAVRALPRIHIVVTGDELVEISKKPGPAQIRASNGSVIRSFLLSRGIDASLDLVGDDPGKLKEAIRKGLEGDALLLSGGVSAGDRDLVPDLLHETGVERVFHKVNIKPGKPIYFGRSNKTAVFGLPGNPFAVLISCRIFISAWLENVFAWQPNYRTALTVGRFKKDERAHFFPVTFAAGRPGMVEPVAFNGSGDVTAGTGSSGLALHPARCQLLEPGDAVEYFPW